MPWIILTAISICLNVIKIIGLFASLLWGEAIGNIIGVLVFSYLWVVVWSHRLDILKIFIISLILFSGKSCRRGETNLPRPEQMSLTDTSILYVNKYNYLSS